MTKVHQPQTPDVEPDGDDRIIGVAFRWSLVVVAIGVLVAGGILWLRREADGPPPVVIPKDPGNIGGFPTDGRPLPEIAFSDITAAAGIDFVHVNGDRGERMLPETMGGGAGFFDYDRDGDPDLLLVNGTTWPWDPPLDPTPRSALYRNDGTGRFEDVSADAGLPADLYGMGVAFGDVDGDGWTDVLLTAVGENRLLRNVEGRFTDVTETAGVGGGDRWSTGAGFFDVDRDGDLDLFVTNYVQWSRDIDLEVNYTLNGVDRAYGPPTNFRGDHGQLFENDGRGRFTEITEAAGLIVDNPATGLPVGKGLAVTGLDIDDDGWIDLVVANDTTRNFLFRNRGAAPGPRFEEIGRDWSLAYDGMGNSTGAMGTDAAFYRNDDDLVVAIGNFANETTSFFVRQAGGRQFSDDAVVEGIGSPSRLVLTFGLFFFDADLDGRLDMLQANGHLESEISELQASQTYRQAAQLFWNAGPGAAATFRALPPERVGDLAVPMVGRGAAFADIDADGDLDVLLTQAGDRPRLLRNDQTTGHHWLRVRLVGGPGNPRAIGARIELEVGGAIQRRTIMPTRSYLSQVEPAATFGLGAHTAVDALRVRWPDGREQVVPVEAVDRELVVGGPDPGVQ